MAFALASQRYGDPFLQPRWQAIALLPAVLLLLALMLSAVQAQTAPAPTPAENQQIVEGTSETMAYTVGRSLRINGTVKNGAIALGGDVIVQGIVEGDVAAIGGSVIQMEGARIGGDVMVVGGAYRHMDPQPLRNSTSQTVMYAGYEEQLRTIMRNPSDLLAPSWSAAYLGLRLLAILFWFIVSLAVTAAMPGTISRGIERLQLSSLRVAIIGFTGAVMIGVLVPSALHYLPSPVSVVVGLMALPLPYSLRRVR